MSLFSKFTKLVNVSQRQVHIISPQRFLSSKMERLLYQSPNRFPVRLIMFGSLTQLVFWSFLSYIILKDLKKGKSGLLGLRFVRPKTASEGDAPPKASLKLRIFLSLLSLCVGILVFDLSLLYSTRQVHRVSLMENDTIVRIVTRNIIGNFREIQRPISCVKSQYALERFPLNKPFLPIKVTDYSWFFSLDMKGHFPSRRQFDVYLHQPY